MAKATENGVNEIIEQETAKAIQRIQEAAKQTPINRIDRLREMRELAELLYRIGQVEESQAVAAKIREELGI